MPSVPQSAPSSIDCRLIVRRSRLALGLLLAAAGFLFIALWTFPLDPFPGLPAPPGVVRFRPPQSLALRLGEWIALCGFDSGPPSEYAYDFLVFWFVAACELIYLLHYTRLRRLARGLGDSLEVTPLTRDQRAHLFLPPNHAAILTFWFPLLVVAILLFSPWNGDNGAQKVFLIVFGMPILLMTGATFRIALKKPPAKIPPHRVEFLYVCLFLVLPVEGGRVGGGAFILLLMSGMCIQLGSLVVLAWRDKNEEIQSPPRVGATGKAE